VVIGIDTAEENNQEEKARAFQQKHGLTYPILVDGKGTVAKAYRAKNLPTNVIIDREGKVRYIEAGFNRETINKMLRELMER
jgi:peroxiredoxin